MSIENISIKEIEEFLQKNDLIMKCSYIYDWRVSIFTQSGKRAGDKFRKGKKIENYPTLEQAISAAYNEAIDFISKQ